MAASIVPAAIVGWGVGSTANQCDTSCPPGGGCKGFCTGGFDWAAALGVGVIVLLILALIAVTVVRTFFTER